MRCLAPFAAAGLALLIVAPPASAQDTPLPSLPPAEPPASGTGSCRLGDHEGIAAPDAQTAALLVCNEILRLGPPVGAHYHVGLGKLGALIIYSVTREGDTPEVTVDVRELRLHGIEEASIAAPRLADAIVHGTAIGETEKFDNIVGEETRRPAKKPGSVHFSLGLLGNLPPLNEGIGPAPGLDLHVHYETKVWELGGGIRFGGGQASSSAPSMGFFMADIGGRYFFSETDVSPYFGGGASWDYLSLTIPGGFSGNNSGLGGYIDTGVEVLRTYHTHLSMGVRAELPFFALNGSTACSSPGLPGAANCSGSTTYYYWPISLEVRVTF